MSKPVKSIGEYWKRFLIVIAIVFAVTVLGQAVFTYVDYPTQSHREVGKELTALQTRPIIHESYDSPQNKREEQLTNTSETQYTVMATLITMIISFALYVYITWKVYVFSRKKRFTSRFRLFTIGTVTIGSVLASIVYVPLTNAILGFNPSPGLSAINIILVTLSTLVITILVVMVVESRYESRHSLVVE